MKSDRTIVADYDRIHPGTRVRPFACPRRCRRLLTSAKYRAQRKRLEDGLRRAGMAE